MPKTRIEWIAMALVTLLFTAMLWGIMAIQQSEIRQLRNNGLPASATVVDRVKKSERSSTGSSSIIHELTVTFMDRSEVVEDEVEVDILSGEFEFGTIDIGEFQRTTFKIRSSSYDTISVGDTVEILYLPDDPSEAMLATEVANWRPTFILIMIWITVLIALYCFVRALTAKPAAPAPPSEFPEWDGAG